MSSLYPVMDGIGMAFSVDFDNPVKLCLSVIKSVGKAVAPNVLDAVWGSPPKWALTVKVAMTDPPSVVSFGNDVYCFMQLSGELWYTYYDGTGLASPVQVPGVSMTCAPGAVVYNNQLYVFYQLAGGSQQLMYVVYNGTSWSTPTNVPEQYLSTAPSAVAYGSDLYVFYQGSNNCGQIYYGVWNGSSWSAGGSLSIPNGMSESPSAVIYNGDIYVFYQNGNNGGQLYYCVYNGSWASAVQVAGVDMMHSPGAMAYGGAIIVFYQYAQKSGELWVTVYDGSSWTTPNEVMPVAMSCSPGAAVYNGQIVAFMQAPMQNGQLWYTIFNGSVVSWMELVNSNTSALMSFSPAATCFTPSGSSTPLLFVCYQGEKQDGAIMYSLYNGSSWTQAQIIPSNGNAIMSIEPTTVQFNDKLYVFYQGEKNNGSLYYCVSSDASSWTQYQLVPTGAGGNWALISESPSAVVFNNQLYVFAQGPRNDGQIYYTSSSDGINWGAYSPIPNISSYKESTAPSAVVFNNQLYVFWSMVGGELCYSVYNGSSWSSVNDVPTVGWNGNYYMSQSPCAIVFTPPGGTETLYVLYQGGPPVTFTEMFAGAGQLWWTSYDGSSWTAQTQVGNYQVAFGPQGASAQQTVQMSMGWFLGSDPMMQALGE